MYSESGAGARTAGGTDFENPDEGQVDDAPQAAPPVMQEEDSPSGRPIGIGETMRRVFHKQIMAVHMDDASPTVLFVKIGVRKDLSVTYHRTNLARETDSNFAVFKIDVKNAFNAASQREVIEALGRREKFKCMPNFTVRLSMVLDGNIWYDEIGELVTSEEGLTQGDSLSMFYFAILMQDPLEELDAALTAHGGGANAGADFRVWGRTAMPGIGLGTKRALKIDILVAR